MARLLSVAGNYWMALMNLYISPWQAIWPRVLMLIGMSLRNRIDISRAEFMPRGK